MNRPMIVPREIRQQIAAERAMPEDLKLYLAVHHVDEMLAFGVALRAAVPAALRAYPVREPDLLLHVAEKLVGCARARTSMQAMDDCDASMESRDTHALVPHSHNVPATYKRPRVYNGRKAKGAA